MGTAWYCLVAFMFTVYVVLDGFDIGAGVVHWWVARSPAERRQVLRAIGPVWDANEVWLIAGGGTLYLAFPSLYAASFSGFYLPLMILLWLFILRGTAVEFRSSIAHPVWHTFWDGVFSLASMLLAVFFGVAVGNVVRGVPLDAEHRFFEPLWTNFRVGADTGILDWYTVLVGALALVALAYHGACWLGLKTAGVVAARAAWIGRFSWWGMVGLTVVVTAASWRLQPQILQNLHARPWGWLFPALAVGSLVATRWAIGRRPLRAFLGSASYLVGMLGSAAFGIFPYLLPARGDSANALSVANAAAPRAGLQLALGWWIVGMGLVAVYFWMLYRKIPSTTDEHDAHGY